MAPDEATAEIPAYAGGRWSAALAGNGTAFRELAETYWYCVYAFLHRAESEAEIAARATSAVFHHWCFETLPSPEQPGAARMRTWLPAQLAALAGTEWPAEMAADFQIDVEWAEGRYAEEPPGEPRAIFERRWALTLLENALATLRGEYEERGEQALFEELLPFAGFSSDHDEAYEAAAVRTGRSASAMRRAVFEFRTRQREQVRYLASETIADLDDLESEMTALLLACDAAGPEGASAPLPSVLQAAPPDQMLARAMKTVQFSGSGTHAWTPPSIAEMARLFPQHEILRMLGRGGMGAVYQARQLSLDRLVAIKLLPLEVSADRDFAERFRREARAMAKLSHPNIISVFDFGETAEGHLFFVMEYVDGMTLHDLIHLGEPLGPADALACVEQVCDALGYAHGKGIIHRDIKPLNVMVDREGRVKVADFGLARLLDNDPAQWGTTMSGVVMGTPDYMAPEQKRGSHVDHRADVYAVGVLLYEALCRELPQGAFALPSKRCGLDKRLDQIVTKALASRPDERFQSTVEMKAALASIRPAVARAQARKCGARTQISAATPEENARRQKLSRRMLVIAGAAVVAALAAVMLLLPRAAATRANSTPQSASTKTMSAPAGTSSSGATLKEPFVNSLGMKFVPVPIVGGRTGGQRVLFCEWVTRVQDYEVYAREANRAWQHEPFQTSPLEPAVNISWHDAFAFCAWLTARERASGKIGSGEAYRLPSDHEWSCAIGIAALEDANAAPAEKQAADKDFTPWGGSWRPPKGAGNIADQSIVGKQVRMDEKYLDGYDDGYAWTSPVGTYAPNALGLYDLYGNVYQWCEELYAPGSPQRTIRGAGYMTVPNPNFPAVGRDGKLPDFRAPHLGFRIVLAAAASAPDRLTEKLEGGRPPPPPPMRGEKREKRREGEEPPPRRRGPPPPGGENGKSGPGEPPPHPEPPRGPNSPLP
jgi:serine/threonine protein kinase